MATENSAAFEAVLGRQRYLVLGGFASLALGVLLAAYVAYEWFIIGTSHEVIALLAGISVLFGVQLLVFASMASMLILLHREQRIYFDGGDSTK